MHQTLEISDWSVILYYKIMKLYSQVFIIFSWCYFVTERFWATFVWYCRMYYIWHHFFKYVFVCDKRLDIELDIVDWISEKANIIAVMDKRNGVYFIIVSSKVFPPLNLGQKSCSPPFCLPPLKLQNLPPPSPFLIPYLWFPHWFIIFKFPPTQNFQFFYNWFAQTDH